MSNLQYFHDLPLILALRQFFENLHIPVNYIDDKPASPQDVLGEYFNVKKEGHDLIEDVYVIGMVDDAAFAESISKIATSNEVSKLKSNYNGLLIFGVSIKKRKDDLLPTRTQLAEITRAFNRAFPYTPVTVVFRYYDYISLANAERQPYKSDSKEGEKIGKVNLLKDVLILKPHRGHEDILSELSIVRTGTRAVTTFSQLYNQWQKVLSTQTLNKRFYQELFHWYLWAKRHIEIPAPPRTETQDKDTLTSIFTIRLLTRILFVWFVKEKKLVPNEVFDQDCVSDILKRFDPNGTLSTMGKNEEGNYYKAILQNLFFATLNTPMDNDPATQEERRQFLDKTKNKNGYTDRYLDQTKYRHENLFKKPTILLQLFKDVPFLNGGLFECLDYRELDGSERRYDGFSSIKSKQAIVPDLLFFSPECEQDLSTDFDNDTKMTRVRTRGLIRTLDSYKFTIAENTPLEEEVALDPELLGKVFENLLASYNPETQTTARKQTGSFYTPREIVSYMVDESLKAYLLQKLSDKPVAYMETGKVQPDMFGNTQRRGQLKLETQIVDHDEAKKRQYELYLNKLFDDAHPENTFSTDNCGLLIQALSDCRILDPACGSGAFPMGILHRMVSLLARLDPKNKAWKESQLNKAKNDLRKAKEMEDATVKEVAIAQAEQRIKYIEESFENTRHELDYTRKLFLIENCIYGVDIQQIAVQIAKLRFFISLISEQQVDDSGVNRNIISMPNLETKFVAANTLRALETNISNKKGTIGLIELRSPVVLTIERRLKQLRKSIFFTRSYKQKKKLKQEEKILRQELETSMIESSWGEKSAAQAAKWDPYDQLHSALFYDTETMFGFIDGFDILIGNPPYGIIFNNEEIVYFRNNYKVVVGHSEAYYLFIEKGIISLKENGVLAYITPNAWLSNKYARGVRNWLLNNTELKVLINLNQRFVFENAGVETSILIVRNSEVKQNFNAIVGNDIDKEALYNFNYSDWLNNEFFNINFSSNPKENIIIKKIQDTKLKLSDLLDISNGFKPYQVGYGYNLNNEPLTKDDVEKKIYHNQVKKGKDYKPQLKGKNVAKYYYDFTEGYIKWGPWLMSPKDEKYFENTKILLRQITGETLLATIDKEKYYADQTLYVAINYTPALVDLEYCLAILNSKLLGFYFRKFYSEEDSLFPKIKVNELKSLPIKRFEKKIETLLASLVNYILIKKKSSSEKNDTASLFFERLIDAVIYELYLPEEVKIGGAEVLKYLYSLPEINYEQGEKSIKTIERVFKELSDPKHLISTALLKLLTIEEINVIEGRK